MIRPVVAAVMLLALAACGTPLPAGTAFPEGHRKPAPAGPPPPPMRDDPVVCAADVRQCPDGNFVSRNPDNGCAFDACPGAGKQ